MSQSPRTCPVCGTSVPAGQRFCSNCGTNVETGQPAGQPPSQYGGPPQQGQQPYPQAAYGQQYGQQGQQYGQQQYGQQFGQPIQPYQQPPKSNPIAEALGALGLLFFLRRYRPGYRPRRQSSGCCGCLVTLIILGIIFGIPAYVYYRANPHVIQQIQNQIQNSSSGGVPTTQPPITTTKIGQTVNYAGDDITVVSVEQSTAFIHDDNTATNGMIRLILKESAGQRVGGFSYGDIARLILPDGTTVAPVSEKNFANPQAGTTQDNWLDFPVSSSIKPNQLKLVLGTDKQAQIAFPLTGNANLSAFEPKTSHPNASAQYAGLTWTVTNAARSLSSGGRQADSGMVFITVTLKVDNPTARDFNGYYGDYIRLKAGGATSAPSTDTTLPLNFPANSSGTTGTVIFQVPSGGNSYTLVFLSTASNPNQASANFNI